MFSREDDVYPVTIMTARYGGTYEGARWLALNLHPHEVPEDATGSDLDCMEFWRDYEGPVGGGWTPMEAYLSLKQLLDDEPEQDYFKRVRGW